MTIGNSYRPGYIFFDEFHTIAESSNFRMEHISFLPSWLNDIPWLKVSGFSATVGSSSESVSKWLGYNAGGVTYIGRHYNLRRPSSAPDKSTLPSAHESRCKTVCYKLVEENPLTHLEFISIKALNSPIAALINLVDPLKNGLVFCQKKADISFVLQSINSHFGTGFAFPLVGMVTSANLNKLYSNQPKLIVGSTALIAGIDLQVDYTVLFCNPFLQETDLLQWLGRQRKKNGTMSKAFEIYSSSSLSCFNKLSSHVKALYDKSERYYINHKTFEGELDIHEEFAEITDFNVLFKSEVSPESHIKSPIEPSLWLTGLLLLALIRKSNSLYHLLP